jgi:solute:Na+ symporter, SSS family
MTTSGLTWVDWLIVAAYFGAVVWLGGYFGRRQQSSERYFLGARSLPGWAVGLSMFATIISSWAFLALPGKAFQSDLQYLMAVSAIPIAAWISVRWMVPLFRGRINLSVYEFLERRFGLAARVYGNLAFLIVHFGKMAAILYLLCLAISQMTGWNIFVLIGVVGVSTVVYTFFGGIEGVVWTDVVQGTLLLIAGFVVAGFILVQTPGGAGAVLETAWAAGKFKLVTTSFSWERSNTLLLVFFGLNFYLQKYVSDQTVVQRYLLSPSSAKAGRALWMSSGLLMLVWALFMTVGVLLWGYYQLQPDLLPAGVRAAPDRVFPYFIANELPVGLPGLLLAGLLAATMSTLSSDLNSLSAVMLDDYYRKIRPGLSDRHHLLVSRLIVLAAGLLGVLLAMAMTRIHSMADAAFDFVSLVGGGVLGMFLLGIVAPRCTARGLYVGIAIGITFVLWAHFCGIGKTALPFLPRFPLHTLWVGLLGNIVVFGCGYLASRLLGGRRPAPPGGVPAAAVSYEERKSNVS